MKFEKCSERGNKVINQDSIVVKILSNGLIYAAISDGMSGHPYGEVASNTIIKECVDFWENNQVINSDKFIKILHQLFEHISKRFEVKSQILGTEMGATFCIVLVYGDMICCAHCGDSRIYLFDKNGDNIYWSKDHIEYKKGYRVITNAFFSNHCADVVPEINLFTKDKIGRILICSD